MTLKEKLDKRVIENEQIIRDIEKDLEILLNKLNDLKKNKTDHKELMVTSSTLLTLKDRMLFHKASIETLNYVLTQLEN